MAILAIRNERFNMEIVGKSAERAVNDIHLIDLSLMTDWAADLKLTTSKRLTSVTDISHMEHSLKARNRSTVSDPFI